MSSLALLGGKPVLYINSKFLTADRKVFQGINNNRMGEEDFTSGSEAELEASANAIYQALEEYRELCDRQLVFIESYRMFDNGLRVTRYEDGVEIIANFGCEPIVYRDNKIEPDKYVIIK